jgi:hypothetical protein
MDARCARPGTKTPLALSLSIVSLALPSVVMAQRIVIAGPRKYPSADLAAFHGNRATLTDAITTVQRLTDGKVIEIRSVEYKGKPGFYTVVLKNGQEEFVVSNRLPSRSRSWPVVRTGCSSMSRRPNGIRQPRRRYRSGRRFPGPKWHRALRRSRASSPACRPPPRFMPKTSSSTTVGRSDASLWTAPPARWLLISRDMSSGRTAGRSALCTA